MIGGRVRAATSAELDALWPAVAADRLFTTRAAFRAYAEAEPWRVRATGRGEAVVLGAWKSGSSVLAIRGVWCAERRVRAFIDDAREQAGEHGFSQLLSPLLPVELLGPYTSAGMRVIARLVAIQGHPELVLPADPPLGVAIREGTRADVEAVAAIDAASFEEFWRWSAGDLLGMLEEERLAVAEANGGAVIGYTLATLIRGSATLTRLAVAPHARHAGVGRSLLSESAAWARRFGAATLSLCTQEDNAASRALYSEAGLAEIPERYAFALSDGV
jgi:ribosomal-protein-alanine N-acetyltransferase